jgi:membrane-bound metal-dependent hydrolase YbcI (DUF457 family)
MIAATHFSFAAVLWYLFTIGISVEFLSYDILCFLALGALMPDIDEPRSAIGWVLFPISWGIRIFLHWGHRQQTHSFLGLGVFTVLMLPIFFLNPIWWLAFGFGYLSHLISDMMTKSGVPLFWPSRIFYWFPEDPNYRFKTGTISEWILLGILTAILSHAIGITRPGVSATIRFFKNSVFAAAPAQITDQTLGTVQQIIELDNFNQLLIKTGDAVKLGQPIARTTPTVNQNEIDFLQAKITRENFAIANRATAQGLAANLKSAEISNTSLVNFREQELNAEIKDTQHKIAMQRLISDQNKKKMESFDLEIKTLTDRYNGKIAQCSEEIIFLENKIAIAQNTDDFDNKKRELEVEIDFFKKEIAEKAALGKSTLSVERNLELARVDLAAINAGKISTTALDYQLESTRTELEALVLERDNKIAELQHERSNMDTLKTTDKIFDLLAQIKKLELEIQKIPAEIETAKTRVVAFRNQLQLQRKEISAEKQQLEADLVTLQSASIPEEIRAPSDAEVKEISLENSTAGKVKIKILFKVVDEVVDN